MARARYNITQRGSRWLRARIRSLKSLFSNIWSSLFRREWRLRAGERAKAGAAGEAAACDYLRYHGFTILAQNARLTMGEADIVALDPDGTTRVIVEVKSRTKADNQPKRSADARGEDNITQEKSITLRAIAAKLARANNWPRVRIDVVAIDAYEDRFEVRHHIGAV